MLCKKGPDLKGIVHSVCVCVCVCVCVSAGEVHPPENGARSRWRQVSRGSSLSLSCICIVYRAVEIVTRIC